MRKVAVLGGVVAFLASAACSYLYAQAFSVPTSNRLLVGELKIGESPLGAPAHLARFEVREGVMITVRSEKEDYWYGFVSSLGSPRKLTVSAFEIVSLGEGRQKAAEVVTDREIDLGSSDVIWLDGIPFEFNFGKVENRKFIKKLVDPKVTKPQVLQKYYGASGGGLCAVSCSGLTVTATSVDMDCGRCNSGAYLP